MMESLLQEALEGCKVPCRLAKARRCLERQQLSEMHTLQHLDVTDIVLSLTGRAATHKYTGGVLWG